MNIQGTGNKQGTNREQMFRTREQEQTESLGLGGLLPLCVTNLQQKQRERNGGKKIT